ncbi:hypothetical protein CHS0354_005683 [Potamilus streckersoni]|uniref:Uncharacterized protein n=1 Tax=Potamilus streckersoni TaxID=2493646 RepID=A0AAE0VN73_9BIVA|nr:hypothetical protein CHS0354_005683 [Potamilus streckersoni]
MGGWVSNQEDLEALRQAALATLKNKTLEKPSEVPVIVTPGDVLENQKRAAQEQIFYDPDFLHFGHDVGDLITPVSMLGQGNTDFLRNFQARGRGMRGRIRGRGRGRGGRGISNANTNLIVISTVPLEGEDEKPKGDQNDKENKPVFLRPQDKWAFGLTDENSRSSLSSPSRPKDKFSRYDDRSDSEEEEDWYEEEEDEDKKEEKLVEEEEEEKKKEMEEKGNTTSEGSDSDQNDTFSDRLKAQENENGSDNHLDEKDPNVNGKDMLTNKNDDASISHEHYELDKKNEQYVHSEARVYDTEKKDADKGATDLDTSNNVHSDPENMDSDLDLEKENLVKESVVESTVKRDSSPLVSESSQSTWSRRRRRRGSVASSSQESDSESDTPYQSRKVSELELGRSPKPESDSYSNSGPKSESNSDSNIGPASDSDSNSDSKSELDSVSKGCSKSTSDSHSNNGSRSGPDSGSSSDSESGDESNIVRADEKVDSDSDLGMSPVKKSSVSLPSSRYDLVSNSENDSDDELHFKRKRTSYQRMRRKHSGGGIHNNSNLSKKSTKVSDSEISESEESHKIKAKGKSLECIEKPKTVSSASKKGSNVNFSSSKELAVEKKNSNYTRTVTHKSRSESDSDSPPQSKNRKLEPHSRSPVQMNSKPRSHSWTKNRKTRSRSRSESISRRENFHSRSRAKSNQTAKDRKSQKPGHSTKEKNKRTKDKHCSKSKSEMKRRNSGEQRKLSYSYGGSEKSISSFSDMDTDSGTDTWRDKKKGVNERHIEDIARERRKRMAQDSPQRIERAHPKTHKNLPDSSGLENRRERVFYKRNQEKRFVEEESDSDGESNRGLRRGLVSVVLGDSAKGRVKNSDLDDAAMHQSRKFDIDRTGNKSSSLIRSVGVKKSEGPENTDSSDEGLRREGYKSPVINITFTTGEVEKPRPSVHERLGLPLRRDRSSGNGDKIISSQLAAVTVPSGGKKIKLSGLSSQRKNPSSWT